MWFIHKLNAMAKMLKYLLMKNLLYGKYNNSTTPYDGLSIILPVSGGKQVFHLYNSRGGGHTSNYSVTVTTRNHHPPF